MSNTTDPLARTQHGMNPQFLIPQITRNRIYSSPYWKEHCFGLNAESLLDKAVGLEYLGSVYGGNNKACPFLCLVLKLLQISPEDSIIDEYICQTEFKYLQALAALYIRLTGSPNRVYHRLEELYYDNRILRVRIPTGRYNLIHMDEFADELLNYSVCLGIDLPSLPSREKLEDNFASALPPRESMMTKEFENMLKQERLDEIPDCHARTQSDIWIK